MKLYETITADNWCKNVLEDGRGRACLVGHANRLGLSIEYYEKTFEAIRVLYPERLTDPESYNADVLGARVHLHRDCGVVDFNNHPDTTVEDVIRVCKFADV